MRIELKKHSANAIINALRHVAMTEIPVLRPIAFAVGTGSNVIEIGDWCEEDMTEFISSLSTMTYAYSGDLSLVKFDELCSGVVNYTILESSGIKVLTVQTKDVLHLRQQARVQVYFRNAPGKFTSDENEKFLVRNGVDASNLTVINSRHCAALALIPTVVEETMDTTVFDVEIVSSCGKSGDEILTQSIDFLTSELNQIKL